MLKIACHAVSATTLLAAAFLATSGFVLACPRVMHSAADVATLGLSVLLLSVAPRFTRANRQLTPAA